MRSSAGRARSMFAADAGNVSGLGHIETAARLQVRHSQMIPAAKLLHGHVKAIGHRNQCVAVFDLVKREPGFAGRCRGHRDDERIRRGKIIARFQLVDEDDLRRIDVVIASDGGQRFSRNHLVKPPLISLVRGDFGDPFLV